MIRQRKGNESEHHRHPESGGADSSSEAHVFRSLCCDKRQRVFDSWRRILAVLFLVIGIHRWIQYEQEREVYMYSDDYVSEVRTKVSTNHDNSGLWWQDQKESVNSARRKVIIHVGLPKTGTTFLQCSLCSTKIAQKLLADHSSTFLGTCPINMCGVSKEQKQEDLNEYLPHRFHLLFDGNPLVPDDIRNPLGPVSHESEDYQTMVRDWKQTKRGTRKSVQLSQNFQQALDRVLDEELNALMIYEGFHRVSQEAIAALHAQISERFPKSDWDVHLIVIYRPLYQWLPSKFHSIFESALPKNWPVLSVDQEEEIDNEETNFPITFAMDGHGKFSKMTHYVEEIQEHPAETVQKNYAQYFDSVKILPLPPPLSSQDDPSDTGPRLDPLMKILLCRLSDELCETLESESHIYAQAFEEELNAKARHKRANFDHDLLARTAFLQNRIPLVQTSSKNGDDEVSVTRTQVRNSMRRFENREIQQGKRYNTMDYPRQCLDEETLQRLYQLSESMEERLFGKDALERHKIGFDKEVAKGKAYCWIDAEKALEDPFWEPYFQDLYRSTGSRRL